jgi:hypothetical protein
MRDHVRLYDGELHVEASAQMLRITALMQDADIKNLRESPMATPAVCIR